MAIDPQVPTAAEIVGPAIRKLIALRPNALTAINSGQGVYSRLVTGWKAQAELMIARLISLTAAGRLKFSEGQDLIDLVASEYDTLPDVGPIQSTAGITLTRTSFPTTTSGVIQKGQRFVRAAVTTAKLPDDPLVLSQQLYEADRDVFIPQGVSVLPDISLVAVLPGSGGNTPIIRGSAARIVKPIDPFFDTAFTVSGFSSAGGHSGTSAPVLRQFAKSFFQGQYAPNDAALIAGAYKLGMRHYRLVDEGTGYTYLYVADDSWSYSATWGKRIQQGLYDNGYVGFGCAVRVLGIDNVLVNVTTTVTLKSANDAYDTSAIDADIQKAIRSHFDDRPDWNIWKTNGLKAVISRSNTKIRSCDDVIVKNSITNSILGDSTGYTHFYLNDNAVTVDYQVP